MMQILRRLGFIALVTGAATCPLEGVVAQSSDKTEPWVTEWKVDRMTDTKTFFLSTNVQTEAGHYYQLVLSCQSYRIAMVLTAFTKNKEARRITTDFRNTRDIQIRFDKNPTLYTRFTLSEYYNRLKGDIQWHVANTDVRHPPQWLTASKSMLIANVFPDEIFEVKTGFDQATIDACNQSSSRIALDTELTIVTSAGARYRFHAEWLKTEPQRVVGLRGRTTLRIDHGMLYDYDPPQPTAFWMRDVLIALDIIFIRADGTIESIFHDAKPRDETPMRSKGSVRAVLEINAGVARRIGIQPGDKVEHPIFDRN